MDENQRGRLDAAKELCRDLPIAISFPVDDPLDQGNYSLMIGNAKHRLCVDHDGMPKTPSQIAFEIRKLASRNDELS